MPYWYHFFSSDIETLSLQLYFWHTCLYNYISEACHVVNDSYTCEWFLHVNDSYTCEWLLLVWMMQRNTNLLYYKVLLYQICRNTMSPWQHNSGRDTKTSASTCPQKCWTTFETSSWDSSISCLQWPQNQIQGLRQSSQTQPDSWGQTVKSDPARQLGPDSLGIEDGSPVYSDGLCVCCVSMLFEVSMMLGCIKHNLFVISRFCHHVNMTDQLGSDILFQQCITSSVMLQ